MGLRPEVIPRNVKGCVDCGHCSHGCPYGAKQSTATALLEPLLLRGQGQSQSQQAASVKEGKAGKAGKEGKGGKESTKSNGNGDGNGNGHGNGNGAGSGRLTLLANCHVLRVITEPLSAGEQVLHAFTLSTMRPFYRLIKPLPLSFPPGTAVARGRAAASARRGRRGSLERPRRGHGPGAPLSEPLSEPLLKPPHRPLSGTCRTRWTSPPRHDSSTAAQLIAPIRTALLLSSSRLGSRSRRWARSAPRPGARAPSSSAPRWWWRRRARCTRPRCCCGRGCGTRRWAATWPPSNPYLIPI